MSASDEMVLSKTTVPREHTAVCVCVCLCVFTCIHIYTHKHTVPREHTAVCVCVCLCVFTCIHIYTHTHTVPREHTATTYSQKSGSSNSAEYMQQELDFFDFFLPDRRYL
jgi:hypothetical protein